MSDKQLYQITPKAGLWLAGRRRIPGATTIELTPEEAEYELNAGTILPSGETPPPFVFEPAIKPTDVITLRRNGADREVLMTDLIAYLYPVLGGGGGGGSATAPGTISTDMADPNTINPAPHV